MANQIEIQLAVDVNDTVNAKNAEAWAVGQRGGVDVGETDPAYHNNAKYYAQQSSQDASSASGSAADAGIAKTAAETAQGKAEDAQAAAEAAEDKAEAWATGGSGGTPTASNNAAYYAMQASGHAGTASRKAGEAINSADAAGGSAAAANADALKAEGYAVGKQNGTDVESGSDYYENNAKYFSEQAADSATTAETAAASASAAYGTDLLAANYDNTATYDVGDHVIYSGDYYVCNTAISVAEAWTAAHWTQVTVGGENADLKSAFNNVVLMQSVNRGNLWENGQISTSAGSNGTSASRMRTIGYVDDVVSNVSVTDGNMIIFAYGSDNTYMGHYNGRGFDKTTSIVNYQSIDLAALRAYYTGYKFRIVWYKSSSYSPTPSTDYTKISFTAYIVKKINDIQTDIARVTEYMPSPNFFDNIFPNDGGLASNGADWANDEFMRSDYIPIDPSYPTLFLIRNQQPYVLHICFYNSSKESINNGGTNNRTQVFGAESTTLTSKSTIPQNAAYCRITTKIANFSGTLCLSYIELGSVIPHNAVFPVSKLSSLYGKTIAFMGDSIVGNFDGETGLCYQIAKRTGATVINCGFGGTRMAYRYGDNVQYTYWNALSGYGLAQAIASGTWTDQDTAVANITGGNAYYPERLARLKAIDWTHVDYIMWEYGTNDFTGAVKVSDTETPTNYYAYDNAYRAAIEAILTTYPLIQIIPITPTWRFRQEAGVYVDDSDTYTANDYEDTPRLLTAFVEQVKDIAKEYHLPCIDDYYTLGANKFTRSAYFNATDGVHPNDSGRARIAEHIASQLDSVI